MDSTLYNRYFRNHVNDQTKWSPHIQEIMWGSGDIDPSILKFYIRRKCIYVVTCNL